MTSGVSDTIIRQAKFRNLNPEQLSPTGTDAPASRLRKTSQSCGPSCFVHKRDAVETSRMWPEVNERQEPIFTEPKLTWEKRGEPEDGCAPYIEHAGPQEPGDRGSSSSRS